MLYEKLKELRTAHGLTQKQLADKCGVAQSCIALLEKGRSEANVFTLIALAKTFGVSIDYLVGLEDELGNNATPEREKPEYAVLMQGEKILLKKYRMLNEKEKLFL